VPDVHFYRCDVTDTPAVEEVCKEIRQSHGEATVLVNNAGIAIGKTVLKVMKVQTRVSLKLTISPDDQRRMRKAIQGQSYLPSRFDPRVSTGHAAQEEGPYCHNCVHGLVRCSSRLARLLLLENWSTIYK
jgi:NAD(P)-dependent dehydrogenase (short-subunit alcohol dehydrogenase family)